LKLKCDQPLSNFAFRFNLRRYTVGGVQSDMTVYDTLKEQEWTMARRYRLTLLSPS